MKKYLLLFALLLGFAFSSAMAQEAAPKKKVAVYMTGSDVDSSIKKVIGSKIVSAVTNTSGFAAVERTSDFLAALSKEQDYQASGEVRDSQIAKLGQRFGVRFVIVADVNEVFDEYFIDARLINVETGLVERTADVTGEMNSAQQVVRMAQTLAADLLKGMGSQNRAQAQSGGNTIRVNGREAVDLGLSVKWATCNVGASSPEQYGGYYAWGETNTKYSYDENNSTTERRSIGNICGTSYDVARATWGGTWRLPSRIEMQELVDLCQWTRTSQGGHNGYKVTGPNGNSIFLPAAGKREGTMLLNEGTNGFYWIGMPLEDDSLNFYAYIFIFTTESLNLGGTFRCFGQSVRPVTD